MTTTDQSPSVANVNALHYVGTSPLNQSSTRRANDWFTPPKYIESARKVLGGFALDPFSSAEANEIVRATRYFTEDDDAFTQPWRSKTMWMNPPYSAQIVAAAMHRLIDAHLAGEVGAAIVLVNNATETKWFQRAMREADAVCFTDHRIAFWNADGKRVTGNTRGQAFLLFGPHHKQEFKRNFKEHGKVILL